MVVMVAPICESTFSCVAHPHRLLTAAVSKATMQNEVWSPKQDTELGTRGCLRLAHKDSQPSSVRIGYPFWSLLYRSSIGVVTYTAFHILFASSKSVGKGYDAIRRICRGNAVANFGLLLFTVGSEYVSQQSISFLHCVYWHKSVLSVSSKKITFFARRAACKQFGKGVLKLTTALVIDVTRSYIIFHSWPRNFSRK